MGKKTTAGGNGFAELLARRVAGNDFTVTVPIVLETDLLYQFEHANAEQRKDLQRRIDEATLWVVLRVDTAEAVQARVAELDAKTPPVKRMRQALAKAFLEAKNPAGETVEGFGGDEFEALLGSLTIGELLPVYNRWDQAGLVEPSEELFLR